MVLNTRLIIDWHNFGYTLMSLSKGGWIVHLARFYEQFFGKWATLHLCVTKAMRNELEGVWGLQGPIYTLYDEPPAHFKPLSDQDKRDFLKRVTFQEHELVMDGQDKLHVISQDKNLKPIIMVSSTSWTQDEDFSILFDALIQYDKLNDVSLPEIYMIITGKGPLKEFYFSKVERMDLKRVVIVSAWLEPLDYPKLLASADLGISLHSSSSGLDLPMKVVGFEDLCRYVWCRFTCLRVTIQLVSLFNSSLNELVQDHIKFF